MGLWTSESICKRHSKLFLVKNPQLSEQAHCCRYK